MAIYHGSTFEVSPSTRRLYGVFEMQFSKVNGNTLNVDIINGMTF